MNIIKNIIIILLSFLCTSVIISAYNYYQESKVYKKIIPDIESVINSFEVYKDAYNKEHARIKVIETENEKLFIQLQTKDSIISRLQDIIKRNKNVKQVSIIKSESVIDTIFINKFDTVNYKVFTDINLDNWVYGNIKSTIDTTEVNLTFKNDIDVILKEEGGLFNKKHYVEVIQNNPYSSTKSLKTYIKKNREKRIGIGPHIGMGYTPINNKFDYYIGIGLQYNVFNF